jgi:hypothetical protein
MRRVFSTESNGTNRSGHLPAKLRARRHSALPPSHPERKRSSSPTLVDLTGCLHSHRLLEKSLAIFAIRDDMRESLLNKTIVVASCAPRNH